MQRLLAQGDEKKGRHAPDIPVVTNVLAITNATIVVQPGQIIEGGSVVVRDGLIEEVGANITLPFDADVIDGTGLMIYPGFIDGYSFAGVPKPESRNDSVAKPGDPPNDRAGITPERDIRNHFNRKDSYIDSLRRVGFTVAHVAPRGGMLPGTGALMLLGARDTNRFFLTGNSSLIATFNGANNVYPATPMGIMAKLRNLFRQAKQLKEQQKLFHSNPNGYVRPNYDPVRSALFPSIEGSTPVLFRTDDDLEVRRALLLSKELGFPLVLAGLKRGDDVADLIRQERIPMFLSLDFPAKVEEQNDLAEKQDSLEESSTPYDSSAKRLPPPMRFEEYNRLSSHVADYRDVEGERNRLTAVRDEAMTCCSSYTISVL